MCILESLLERILRELLENLRCRKPRVRVELRLEATTDVAHVPEGAVSMVWDAQISLHMDDV